jgi:hypothetical protein
VVDDAPSLDGRTVRLLAMPMLGVADSYFDFLQHNYDFISDI